MDQQRLGGVADARALHLGVEGDRAGHLEVGVLVDVDVAVARCGVEDRDLGDLLERGLQAVAAAGDDQVDEGRAGGRARRAPRGRRRRPSRSCPRACRPRRPPPGRCRRGSRWRRGPSSIRAGPRRCRSSGRGRLRRPSRSGAPRRRSRRRRSATRLCSSSMPLGSVFRSISSPTGSGSSMIASTPTAIASMRSGVSRRRSISAGSRPAASPRSRSVPFASRISAVRSRRRRAVIAQRLVLDRGRDAREQQGSLSRAAADIGDGFGCDGHGQKGNRTVTPTGCLGQHEPVPVDRFLGALGKHLLDLVAALALQLRRGPPMSARRSPCRRCRHRRPPRPGHRPRSCPRRR